MSEGRSEEISGRGGVEGPTVGNQLGMKSTGCSPGNTGRAGARESGTRAKSARLGLGARPHREGTGRPLFKPAGEGAGLARPRQGPEPGMLRRDEPAARPGREDPLRPGSCTPGPPPLPAGPPASPTCARGSAALRPRPGPCGGAGAAPLRSAPASAQDAPAAAPPAGRERHRERLRERHRERDTRPREGLPPPGPLPAPLPAGWPRQPRGFTRRPPRSAGSEPGGLPEQRPRPGLQETREDTHLRALACREGPASDSGGL